MGNREDSLLSAVAPMSLRLSAAELRAIARVSRVLVAPLDHPSPDGWRRAVNDALRDLFGADAAMFLLAGAGPALIYSDEIPPDPLTQFPELQPPPTADGSTVLERAVADGVSTIDSVYRTRDHGYFRSGYYNEYMRPAGADHLLSLSHTFVRGAVDPLQLGNVQLTRGPAGVRPFGERDRLVASLVHPAFVVGLETLRRFATARTALLDMLDGLAQAVLVLDREGRAVHETPALAALLAQDPDRGAVRRAMRLAAAGVPHAPARTLGTRWSTYRLQATTYAGAQGEPGGRDALVLVALDRTSPVARSDADLRAAFGLTPAELRVARLLAQGKRNAEIAALLGITEHTARRHTERVLAKTGAPSRAAVASRLLG